MSKQGSEFAAFESWAEKQPGSTSEAMNQLFFDYAWEAWEARARLGDDELRNLIQEAINTVDVPKSISYRQGELFKAGARAVIAKVNDTLKGKKL